MPLPAHLLQPLCTAKQMQYMDQRAIEKLSIPGLLLMENAGRSVADFVENQYLHSALKSKITICCGKGNNGGDGYVIARQLRNRGYQVFIIMAGPCHSEDAAFNQVLWMEHFGQSILHSHSSVKEILEQSDLIIDAIFGTGLVRTIEGGYKEWIQQMNQAPAPILAVDLPSGIHADSGNVLGVAVEAQDTLCFQVAKQGCFQYPGAKHAGHVHTIDISIPIHWESNQKPTYLSTKPFVAKLLPQRWANSHKGTYGHLLLINGSSGMAGSALLASYAGLKCGAGLVSACVPLEIRDQFLGVCPEVMTFSPPHAPRRFFSDTHLEFIQQYLARFQTIVLGCGIGLRQSTATFVKFILQNTETPLILDADGLNNITSEDLIKRKAPTIITPHPKELSRLCKLSVDQIQSNRIEVARKYAQQWQVILVLKGALTVIASPQGEVFVNPTGNEGMATAGAGDVLSGMIGSFLSQTGNPLSATLVGVYVHGLSGDLALKTLHSRYLSAMDLIHFLNDAFQAFISKKSTQRIS